MIAIKKGDLLHATEDIIAHQVNCFGTSGGLAAAVFRRWPAASGDYHQITDRLQATAQQMSMLGHAQLSGQQPDGKIIANLYGQYFPGQDFRPGMLERAMGELADFARATGRSVAMPYGISCGICGGDLGIVRGIIERTMDGVAVTLYKKC